MISLRVGLRQSKNVSVFSSFQESLNPTSYPSLCPISSIPEVSLDPTVRLFTVCNFFYKDNRPLLQYPRSASLAETHIEVKTGSELSQLIIELQFHFAKFHLHNSPRFFNQNLSTSMRLVRTHRTKFQSS